MISLDWTVAFLAVPAGVLACAGASKLLLPSGQSWFYGLVGAPADLHKWIARGLGLLELSVATAMVATASGIFVGIGVVVLGTYLSAVIWLLRHRVIGPCQCFGLLSGETISNSVAMRLAILVGSLVVWLLVGAPSDIDVRVAVAVGTGISVLVCLCVAGWLKERSFRSVCIADLGFKRLDGTVSSFREFTGRAPNVRLMFAIAGCPACDAVTAELRSLTPYHFLVYPEAAVDKARRSLSPATVLLDQDGHAARRLGLRSFPAAVEFSSSGSPVSRRFYDAAEIVHFMTGTTVARKP